MGKTFFLPLFHVVFKVLQKFSDFLLIMVVPLFYSGIFYQSNYKNRNITTFFVQKQGTNEMQRIYFGGRREPN